MRNIAFIALAGLLLSLVSRATAQTVDKTPVPVEKTSAPKPIDKNLDDKNKPGKADDTLKNGGKPAPLPGVVPGGTAPPAEVAPQPEKPPLSSYSELVKLAQDKPAEITKVKFLYGRNTVEVTLTTFDKPVLISIPPAGAEPLITVLLKAGVQVEGQDSQQSFASGGGAGSMLLAILMTFGPVVLLVGVMIFLARRQANGGSYKSFTNSKGKAVEELKDRNRVTFDDVAGCDEAVTELRRIIHGLVDPEVNDHFGGERPRGIVLEGPPGTGKTLLAKAVATEADGTMSIISGSDFVELFVGVGASRVRSLVAEGEANFKKTGKPHIIFIDELDAIGGKRSSGSSPYRNDEREGTLNAILVAMDGVGTCQGIIWMAATNRIDMLDDALLRPGRFTCQVRVSLPDRNGRAKIFAIHSRNKPLATEVSLDKLAVRTYGYSGAQIKEVCSRAALLAGERWSADNKEKLAEYRKQTPLPEDKPQVRTYGFAMAGFHRSVPVEQPKREKSPLQLCKEDPTAVITLKEFDEAIDFVLYGDASRSRQASMMREEKENTAYHEAGHAVAAAALGKYADPVAKITILARSKALGYVQQIPDNDRYSINVDQLVSRMIMAMAGRAAQEIYLNTCDTGAQNDFQQVTDIAYRMVTEWGMSRLGRISVGSRTTMSRNMDPGSGPRIGSELENAIDREWQRIVDACAEVAYTIVRKEKARMEATVKVLMERETILRDEWETMLAAIPSAVAPEELRFDPRKKEESDSKAQS